MRSFQEHLNDFDQRGSRILAISVDSPEENREHCQKMSYTYTFLSDPHAEVIRRYDLLHPRASPSGQDVARPAEFLLNRQGKVVWENLTEDFRVRARPEQVLKVIDEKGLAAPPICGGLGVPCQKPMVC